MNIKAEKADNFSIVSINESRLDKKTAIEFKDFMKNSIEEGNIFFVLNMNKVDFIDSSGLGAIVSSLKLIGRSGDIVLSGVNDAVMQMLVLTRMNRVFKITNDIESAIKELT
jgi:anti-sigma B factor antagonist